MTDTAPTGAQRRLLANVAAGNTQAMLYNANTLRACMRRGWVTTNGGHVKLLDAAPDPDGDLVAAALELLEQQRKRELQMARRHFERMARDQRADFVRWAAARLLADVEVGSFEQGATPPVRCNVCSKPIGGQLAPRCCCHEKPSESLPTASQTTDGPTVAPDACEGTQVESSAAVANPGGDDGNG